MELDELIKVARNCRNKTLACEGCEYMEKEGKGGFCLDFLIGDLADALEQMKRERDAAVADIAHICWLCKYNGVKITKPPCRDCFGASQMERKKWEWRGV